VERRDYRATPEPRLVAVGPATYLATPARAELGTERFLRAAAGLVRAGRELRRLRQARGASPVAGPVEAVAAGRSRGPTGRGATWKVLLRVPDDVGRDELRQAALAAGVEGATLETLEEGLCIQALVLGGPGQREQVLGELAEAARLEGLAFRGATHLVFLGDPAQAVPGQNEPVIVRQPLIQAVLEAPERRPPVRFEELAGMA
jgi:hypothetical protein